MALVLIAFMILESAHVVSPIVLAWSHPGLRLIVRREWFRHILLPPLIVTAALMVPPQLLFGLYWTWNIHHFGMQNFGVWALLRPNRSPDTRVRRALLCLAITTFGMALMPLFAHGVVAWATLSVVFDLNHWLVDIGMSSRASRFSWAFAALVLAVGVGWLLLRQGPLSAGVVPSIIAFRWGIGIVHFIYSARIWRLSDPQVRAAIAPTLVSQRPIRRHSLAVVAVLRMHNE